MDVNKRLAEVAAAKKLAEQYGVSDMRVQGPMYMDGKLVTPGSEDYYKALQKLQGSIQDGTARSYIGPATGSYGGPGGPVNFTTAPGTVGSTLTGGGSSGGFGGIPGGAGGGGGGSAGRDPMATAALSRLEEVAKGGKLPIDEATKANMLSKQSDMSAAMEAQQNAALRRTTAAGGGSLYDPSHAAGEAENAEERQLANMGAKRDIDLGAQEQNWEAQFAANRLLAAQADGGINSGNPYGQNGRYGTAQQAGSQEYGSTDPRRGGNIQPYEGYNFDPTKMNNTVTDQYQQAQAQPKQPYVSPVKPYQNTVTRPYKHTPPLGRQ